MRRPRNDPRPMRLLSGGPCSIRGVTRHVSPIGTGSHRDNEHWAYKVDQFAPGTRKGGLDTRLTRHCCQSRELYSPHLSCAFLGGLVPPALVKLKTQYWRNWSSFYRTHYVFSICIIINKIKPSMNLISWTSSVNSKLSNILITKYLD